MILLGSDKKKRYPEGIPFQNNPLRGSDQERRDRGNTAVVVNAEQPQTHFGSNGTWSAFYQNELSNPDIYYLGVKRKYKMPFVRARKECSLVPPAMCMLW